MLDLTLLFSIPSDKLTLAYFGFMLRQAYLWRVLNAYRTNLDELTKVMVSELLLALR